jgi:hypothetical protein
MGGIRPVDTFLFALLLIVAAVMFMNRGAIQFGGGPSGASFAVGYTGK